MTQRIFGLIAAAGVFAAGAPALAHHSVQAEFDMSKTGKFVGELKRFANINPHPRWFFEITNPDGTVTPFEISAGGGRNRARNMGILRTFKVGDTYTVTYAPAWNGADVGRMRDIVFPDGRVVTIFHADPNNPLDN